MISSILRKSLFSSLQFSPQKQTAIAACIDAIRKCSHEADAPSAAENYSSISVNKKSLTSPDDLKFQKSKFYTVALTCCEISKPVFEKLIRKIESGAVRELILARSTIPDRMLSPFIESCLLSELSVLNLTGIELSNQEIELLVDLLPQSQIRSIAISPLADQTKVIEKICADLGIQLTLIPLKKKDLIQVPQVPVSSTKNILFISSSLQSIVQGGFDSYPLINTRSDFLKMIPLLQDGFLITQIFSKNEVGFQIKGFVFTIAPGRGFICPFNQPFIDAPQINIYDELKKIFENGKIPKIFSFYRYDFSSLKEHQITPKGLLFDLQFAKKYLNNKKLFRVIKNIKKLYVPEELRSTKSYDFASEKNVSKCIQTANLYYQVYLRISSELQKLGIFGMFTKILLPIEENLMLARRRGIPLDLEVANQLKADFQSQIEQTKQNFENLQQFSKKNDRFLDRGIEILKNFLPKFWKEKIESEPEPGSIEKYIASNGNNPDEQSILSHYFRLKIKEQNIDAILEKSDGQTLKAIYRTPDLFRGIQLIPNPSTLPERVHPKLFRIGKEHLLLSLEIDELFIRTLAQLSNDPTLIKVCNNKSPTELQNKINAKVFGSLDFLQKTISLNQYACGLIKQEQLHKILHHPADELIEKYYQSFPLVRAFHEKMDHDSYKIYKKIRMHANTLFSMHYIFISKKLEEAKISANILLAANGRAIYSLKKADLPEFKQLVSNVQTELSSGNVKTPIFIREINDPNDSPDRFEVLNQKTQGVISDIEDHVEPSLGNFVTPFEEPSMEIKNQVEQMLASKFPSIQLKPLQKSVIYNILQKKSTIALLPTGYGKSLCFQLPAMINDGVTVVVCPLVSLIQNQLQDLKKKSIPALWVKTLNDVDYVKRRDTFKIIYVTPELLSKPMFIEKVKQLRISLCVIDEAHCVYEWGNTFRQSYRELGKIKEHFPDITILALSATMTKLSLDDFIQSVKIDNPTIVKGSLLRKNLKIQMLPAHAAEKQLLEYLQSRLHLSGIIYCQTRDQVDTVHQFLNQHKIANLTYHAGMSREEREGNLMKFINNQVLIMVATVAFGMGVDKPDIRYVYHMSMPGSLEQYFQEIGRAGRDGNSSECVMLYSDQDFIQSLVLKNMIENPEIQKKLILKSNQLLYVIQTNLCRQQQIARYFTGEISNEVCGSCDVCQNTCMTRDIREFALLALKAVLLTNGNQGIGYLSKLLCASEIHHFPHTEKNSSIFGSLKDYSPSEVRSLYRYLIQRGYIQTLPAKSDLIEESLGITQKALDLAHSNTPIFAPLFIEKNKSVV
jgi:ATP-dependent DNA helicase RecQ